MKLDAKDKCIAKDICPECGHKLILKWSGVKCSHCDWWFCY